MDFYGLAGPHVFELRLLEVRRDPKVLKRDQSKQILARGQVLIDLNALAGDYAVSRGDDLGNS